MYSECCLNSDLKKNQIFKNPFFPQKLSDITLEVAQYIKNNESNPGGWYWPLVKSVTIKTPNCRELLEHIVLVDIPGTGDCNKIRDGLWRSVNTSLLYTRKYVLNIKYITKPQVYHLIFYSAFVFSLT